MHLSTSATIDQYDSHFRNRDYKFWDTLNTQYQYRIIWFNLPSMERVWAYYGDGDIGGSGERTIAEMEIPRNWAITQSLNPDGYLVAGTILETMARQEAFELPGQGSSPFGPIDKNPRY